MRVAVVDIGTNSTRLLVADVENGRVKEIVRRSTVTRLGEEVDRTGRLLDSAIERVLEVCEDYSRAIGALAVERTVAVLTSAVRDAANGPQFQAMLRERFGFEAETITGEREARLTYLGATNQRPRNEPLLVVDIGGGSTEFVLGVGEPVEFFASTQAGSVRHTERSLASDPPTAKELRRCSNEIRREIEDSVPPDVRRRATDGIAVAGTPTSFAAIDQGLEPYAPERVEGYRLTFHACERILCQLAALPLEQRRQVRGLHPDRAPTIVAGGIILLETMRAFELDSVEVSEHDLLEGAALQAADPRKTANWEKEKST